jgi:hypothetical protein
VWLPACRVIQSKSARRHYGQHIGPMQCMNLHKSRGDKVAPDAHRPKCRLGKDSVAFMIPAASPRCGEGGYMISDIGGRQ